MGHDNHKILLQFEILVLSEEDDTRMDVQNSLEENASLIKQEVKLIVPSSI
jgi:hypothetical protein